MPKIYYIECVQKFLKVHVEIRPYSPNDVKEIIT